MPNVIRRLFLQNVPVKPRLVKATGTTSLQSKVEKENVTEKVVVGVVQANSLSTNRCFQYLNNDVV